MHQPYSPNIDLSLLEKQRKIADILKQHQSSLRIAELLNQNESLKTAMKVQQIMAPVLTQIQHLQDLMSAQSPSLNDQIESDFRQIRNSLETTLSELPETATDTISPWPTNISRHNLFNVSCVDISKHVDTLTTDQKRFLETLFQLSLYFLSRLEIFPKQSQELLSLAFYCYAMAYFFMVVWTASKSHK